MDSSDFTPEKAHMADDPRLSDPRLSPLESQVLHEYAKLRQNLDELSQNLADLAAQPSSTIADGLRGLERKTALVCTALKSSVYSIVLQQQMEFAEGSETDG